MAAFPAEHYKLLQELFHKEEDRQNKREFYQALLRVKQAMTAVPKLGYNDHTKSHYALADDIMRMLMPLQNENGIVSHVDTEPHKEEGWSTFVLTLTHAVTGYSRLFPLPMPIDAQGFKGTSNKTAVQGQVSSASYAEKKLYCMAYAIPLGEDIDGNAPVERVTKQQAIELQTMHDQLPEVTRKRVGKWLALGWRAHFCGPRRGELHERPAAIRRGAVVSGHTPGPWEIHGLEGDRPPIREFRRRPRDLGDDCRRARFNSSNRLFRRPAMFTTPS